MWRRWAPALLGSRFFPPHPKYLHNCSFGELDDPHQITGGKCEFGHFTNSRPTCEEGREWPEKHIPPFSIVFPIVPESRNETVSAVLQFIHGDSSTAAGWAIRPILYFQ